MYGSTDFDPTNPNSGPLPPDESKVKPSPHAPGDVPPDLRDLIPLSEVSKHLPRRKGKDVHRCTVGRWMTRGCYGVPLKNWVIGGQRYTTLEAIREFIRELAARSGSNRPPPSRPPAQHTANEAKSLSPSTSRDAMRRRIDRIEANLKRFGL